MTSTSSWHKSYRAALLETDWTKIGERLLAAESEIHKRQHALSMDHGGTLEERQAIADALNGMKTLRREVDEWETQHLPDAGPSPHH
jgi:hypothetical protein